jgi:hypothetical protein
MNRHDIREEYFKWLYDIVCKDRHVDGISYIKLLRQLHDTEFTYLIKRDENRAESGIDLRYRFAITEGYKDISDQVLRELDAPCSVLEMMVALALSCEENIMDDASYGNRTGQWFWAMIVSLGLGRFTDARYDRRLVNAAMSRFLNREYEPNGKGGLFTIRNCDADLREEEIWVQMCWYLDSIM